MYTSGIRRRMHTRMHTSLVLVPHTVHVTVVRYRRTIDTDVIGHYRVCIASVSTVCIAAVSNIETSVSNIDESCPTPPTRVPQNPIIRNTNRTHYAILNVSTSEGYRYVSSTSPLSLPSPPPCGAVGRGASRPPFHAGAGPVGQTAGQGELPSSGLTGPHFCPPPALPFPRQLVVRTCVRVFIRGSGSLRSFS